MLKKNKLMIGIILMIVGFAIIALNIALIVNTSVVNIKLDDAFFYVIITIAGWCFIKTGFFMILEAFVTSEQVYKIALKETFNKYNTNMYDYMTDELIDYCAKNCCDIDVVFYLVTNSKYEPEFNL